MKESIKVNGLAAISGIANELVTLQYKFNKRNTTYTKDLINRKLRELNLASKAAKLEVREALKNYKCQS